MYFIPAFVVYAIIEIIEIMSSIIEIIEILLSVYHTALKQLDLDENVDAFTREHLKNLQTS